MMFNYFMCESSFSMAVIRKATMDKGLSLNWSPSDVFSWCSPLINYVGGTELVLVMTLSKYFWVWLKANSRFL